MTKQLRFEGCSDDTFGEYGVTKIDDDNASSGRPIVFRVRAEGEGFYVYGFYDPKGVPESSPACWIIGIQQLDEDRIIPRWPMRFEGIGYSPVLFIDAPDDVEVELVR